MMVSAGSVSTNVAASVRLRSTAEGKQRSTNVGNCNSYWSCILRTDCGMIRVWICEGPPMDATVRPRYQVRSMVVASALPQSRNIARTTRPITVVWRSHPKTRSMAGNNKRSHDLRLGGQGNIISP